jgi:hypothetical protein
MPLNEDLARRAVDASARSALRGDSRLIRDLAHILRRAAQARSVSAAALGASALVGGERLDLDAIGSGQQQIPEAEDAEEVVVGVHQLGGSAQTSPPTTLAARPLIWITPCLGSVCRD